MQADNPRIRYLYFIKKYILLWIVWNMFLKVTDSFDSGDENVKLKTKYYAKLVSFAGPAKKEHLQEFIKKDITWQINLTVFHEYILEKILLFRMERAD